MPDDPITGLRPADPLNGREVDEDLLEKGRDELVNELVASDPETGVPALGLGGPRRFGLLRLSAILGVVGAVALALLLTGNSGSSQDQTAEAAYTARAMSFARSTPLVLLGSRGWEVHYVDSYGTRAGTMVFRKRGESGALLDAELSWQGGKLKMRRYARTYRRSIVSRRAPVLGTRALVYSRGFAKGPRLWSIMARWGFEGRVMTMRAMVPGKRSFLTMLARLKKVDAESWLDAMPQSVIKAADSPAAVQMMLEGVPLPPGFDGSKTEVPGLAQDRYQLGATVVTTVVCSWFDIWAKARRQGDDTAEREAERAMATSKDWPVLRRMSRHGGHPDVIWSFADHMRSGKYFGRPLAREVKTSLSCPAPT